MCGARSGCQREQRAVASAGRSSFSTHGRTRPSRPIRRAGERHGMAPYNSRCVAEGEEEEGDWLSACRRCLSAGDRFCPLLLFRTKPTATCAMKRIPLLCGLSWRTKNTWTCDRSHLVGSCIIPSWFRRFEDCCSRLAGGNMWSALPKCFCGFSWHKRHRQINMRSHEQLFMSQIEPPESVQP